MWSSGWSTAWYRPSTSFYVGWGLGGLGLGYTSYANPYYIASPTTVYNYSQPLVVEVPVAVADTGVIDDSYSAARAAQPPEPAQPPVNAALITEGLDSFRIADYAKAIKYWDDAIQQDASDPVLHELLALGFYATGEYQTAAAVLNALLAASPGMDWTTLSGLYGDIDLYTQQLRRLENHIEQQPDDAAAMFVLAYHYLVTGAHEEAADLLEAVVRLQPEDQVARDILQGLTSPQLNAPLPPAAAGSPPATDPAAAAETLPAGTAESLPPAADQLAAEEPGDFVPDVDLDWIGSWKAEDPRVTIELTVDDQFQFTWKAIPKVDPAAGDTAAADPAAAGAEPVTLTGELLVDGDFLVLDSPEFGAMVGQIPQYDDDEFRFVVAGAPEDEPGLTFKRQ